MLGFNHLGRMGQLGNQMFQYASLKGIATNRGYDYMVANHEDTVVDSLGNRLRCELFNPFDVNVRTGVLNGQYVNEPHFHFSQDLFDNCPDNVSLVGYYQSPKYFNHIADDIRYDFKFRHEFQKPCEEMMRELDKPVALHVRRGDFITNVENHFNQTMEYYEEAVKHFPDRQIVVFSDDPEWCKETFEGDEYMVSENKNPYVDMCLMTMCSDFIIANSTFSWWPAWLSVAEDKKVVYPKQWFGVTGYTKDHDVTDLFPRRWIKL